MRYFDQIENNISGVYRIYSKATNQSYYGSSINLRRRLREHRYKFKNKKVNHKILELLNKYGFDNFIFELIEKCSPSEFELKEKKYIESDSNCLNVWINPFSSVGCKLGDNVKGKKFYGTKHTQATIDKQRKAIKDYYSNHDGYWKGKSLAEETKKKVSAGLRKYYSKNLNVRAGATLTQEIKNKVSHSLKSYYSKLFPNIEERRQYFKNLRNRKKVSLGV